MSKKHEIDKTMKKVIDAIISIPEEEPVLYFSYPKEYKPITRKEFTEWVDIIGDFKSGAKRFEEQERGSALSVDRAVIKYFRPECNKMFDYIKKFGLEQ